MESLDQLNKNKAPSSGVTTKNFNYVKADYVSIVDINAPFISMVSFYFKWSFAVIPTVIFWYLIWTYIIEPEMNILNIM